VARSYMIRLEAEDLEEPMLTRLANQWSYPVSMDG